MPWWRVAHLPQRWRLGARYGEFSEVAAEGERWSEDARHAYQVAQLRAVLIHAAATALSIAPASRRPISIRRRCATSRDLSACPFIEKQDLLDHLPQMVSTQCPPSDRLYMTTGGSTGIPVGSTCRRASSRAKEQAFLETMWRRAGYFDGARLAVIRGFVTSSAAGGRITSYDATRDWLMLSSYHLTQERLPEYLDALERFRPDCSTRIRPPRFSWRGIWSTRSNVDAPPSRGALRIRAPDDSPEAPARARLPLPSVPLVRSRGARRDGGRRYELGAVLLLPQYGHVEFGRRMIRDCAK
jgi:hypothetical protein